MERNTHADGFVNCVVRRGDRDVLIKPWLLAATLLVPMIVGVVLCASAIESDSASDSPVLPSGGEPMLELAIAVITLNIALAAFMVYSVARRNRNHLKRDREWMGSLCGLVDSHGGDATRMREVMDRESYRSKEKVTGLSGALCGLIIVIVASFGVVPALLDVDVPSLLLMACAFVLLVLEFMATIGIVFGLPSTHDKVQSEFTKELKAAAAPIGLNVPAMEHTVRRRWQLVHIVLMVCTVGLYSFVYLFLACKSMNKHIRAQWAYEEDLMRRVISFEGGTGIEATEEGSPSRAARIARNLFRRRRGEPGPGARPAPSVNRLI